MPAAEFCLGPRPICTASKRRVPEDLGQCGGDYMPESSCWFRHTYGVTQDLFG